MFRIACIVEGHGDVKALPFLLRRVFRNIDPDFQFSVHNPIRLARGKILKDEELQRVLGIAAAAVGDFGAILIVFDADDDLPCTLGPAILQKAQSFRPDKTIRTVLANREFESWFIAAASSLAGKRGLPENLVTPDNPENIRGAKEWLKSKGASYKETVDQQAFVELFDLNESGKTIGFICKIHAGYSLIG